MGVAVSGWRLARAVAATGQLGVVSGVALDVVLARRLQSGDPDGDARRALGELPLPGVAGRILSRYFVPGGIPAGQPFRPVPRLGLRPNPAGTELAVAGNFVEVYLAKQGHHGPVGINYLEKVQMATPAAAYGAMLAGVDYVLMGAGIPAEIPGLLDSFAAGGPGELTVTVAGADAGTRYVARLDPAALHDGRPPSLHRPVFLAIVSSTVLAQYLARSPATAPDGFVLEGPGAGGHSAPPRGRLHLDDTGQPVYGPRDEIDLAKVAALGRPFWLAGGQADAGQLARARAAGAQGIQVGTAFALCRESGIEDRFRGQLVAQALAGMLDVRNEPAVSPAGFPFKVARVGRDAGRRRGLRGPGPAVRSGLPAGALPARGGPRRLPLPGRAHRRVPAQGRDGRETRPGAGACATGCWPPSGSRSAPRPGPSRRCSPWARISASSPRSWPAPVPPSAPRMWSGTCSGPPGAGAPIACPACWNR